MPFVLPCRGRREGGRAAAGVREGEKEEEETDRGERSLSGGEEDKREEERGVYLIIRLLLYIPC